MPAGNYIFKQEVEGTYPGTPTIVCSKEFTVNLQGVNQFLSIIVNNNELIKCHDAAVKFDFNIPHYLWELQSNGILVMER